MAPKRKFTRELFESIAESSAAKERDKCSSGVLLNCEYLHEPDEAPAKEDGTLRRETSLTFRWKVEGRGVNECCEVQVRANHATERGVAIPELWRTAMQCFDLDRSAEQSASDARSREAGLTDIECLYVGRAKTPMEGTGKVVALNLNGARAACLLCAHVENEEWLVHRGSFVEGQLADNPLALPF